MLSHPPSQTTLTHTLTHFWPLILSRKDYISISLSLLRGVRAGEIVWMMVDFNYLCKNCVAYGMILCIYILYIK